MNMNQIYVQIRNKRFETLKCSLKMYNSVIWMTIRLDRDKFYFNIRNSSNDLYVMFYVNVHKYMCDECVDSSKWFCIL